MVAVVVLRESCVIYVCQTMYVFVNFSICVRKVLSAAAAVNSMQTQEFLNGKKTAWTSICFRGRQLKNSLEDKVFFCFTFIDKTLLFSPV